MSTPPKISESDIAGELSLLQAKATGIAKGIEKSGTDRHDLPREPFAENYNSMVKAIAEIDPGLQKHLQPLIEIVPNPKGIKLGKCSFDDLFVYCTQIVEVLSERIRKL